MLDREKRPCAHRSADGLGLYRRCELAQAHEDVHARQRQALARRGNRMHACNDEKMILSYVSPSAHSYSQAVPSLSVVNDSIYIPKDVASG